MRHRTREPGVRSLLAYAAPAIPLALLTLPFYVVVPQFYATALAIPLVAVGQALLFVRLIDAVLDPAVGLLADRTRSRFGRRRTWFALSIVPLTIASIMVFMPPLDAGALYLFGWGTALSIAWTCALVPYSAWGAELSSSHDGRSRVAAFRETAVVAGTLLAILAAALVPALGLGGDRQVLAIFAWSLAIILPAAAIMAVLVVPEPQDHSTRTLSLSEGARHLMGNRPFLRLVAAFFLNGFANGLPATLFLFYVSDRLEAPQWRGALLLAYFLVGILGVPIWLSLAGRFGKHRSWCWAMLLACLAFAVAPWLGAGDVLAFAGVCVVTGLALGADLVLPASLQADVIDVDTARTGEQRSGVYLALWSLATKLALAISAGIAFPLLAWSGFDPAAGASSPGGLAMLAFLYAGAPVVLKLAAIALMWNFPLGPAEHAALRQEIEAAAPQSLRPRQPVARETAAK